MVGVVGDLRFIGSFVSYGTRGLKPSFMQPIPNLSHAFVRGNIEEISFISNKGVQYTLAEKFGIIAGFFMKR